MKWEKTNRFNRITHSLNILSKQDLRRFKHQNIDITYDKRTKKYKLWDPNSKTQHETKNLKDAKLLKLITTKNMFMKYVKRIEKEMSKL